jgi:chaperonin GroES
MTSKAEMDEAVRDAQTIATADSGGPDGAPETDSGEDRVVGGCGSGPDAGTAGEPKTLDHGPHCSARRYPMDAVVDIEAAVSRYRELVRRNDNFVSRLFEGSMEFDPKNDRVVAVVVECAESIEVAGTDKKIYRPETARDHERAPRGVVITAGPGRVLDNGERRPMEYGPGDWIQFGRFAGQRMRVPAEELAATEDMELIILNADEIHGKWREKAAPVADKAEAGE